MTKIFPRVRFDKKQSEAEKYFLTFLFGGVGYGLIEIIWRGRTHPSMVITGGVCLMLMRAISRRFRSVSVLKHGIVCAVLCAASVTAVEFAVGCVVNIWLRLGVWDYSNMKFNLLGQVCPLYSALWFCLCLPIVFFMSLGVRKNAYTASNAASETKKRQKALSFSKKV